jgi:membrane protease YdiL (CAAX protease family)
MAEVTDFSNVLGEFDWSIVIGGGLFVLCALGVGFLIVWLAAYSGPAALKGCPERRNRLAFYIPFTLIGFWLVMVLFSSLAAEFFTEGGPVWLAEFTVYMIITAIEVVLIGAMLFIANYSFEERLKGFGLNPKTIFRDFYTGAVNFVAVYPLVMGALVVVMYAGKILMGQDFEMITNEVITNEGLVAIMEMESTLLKVLLVGSFAVVIPIFEEMLFRGILQSMIKGYISNPWIAILLSSVTFAVLHPWMHWPAIFMLSLGLGYSYERGGSLFRPMFMHVLFNGASITAALLI